MSLPARKLPGARRRRKRKEHLERVRLRLLRGSFGQWTTSTVNGRRILRDVQKMIELLKKDREQ